MNHPLIPKSSLLANRHRPNKSTRGIALILVLAIIVLVSALVVGFLTLATSERQTSAAYAHNVETRMLSESAVDMVMGQIRNATSNLGNTKTWASQPGMIRVFGTQDGGDGLAKLDKAYKLYSSDQMVTDTVDVSKELPANNWAKTPALYTDLNQPVNGVYPIIDGNGLQAGGTTTYQGTNGKPAIQGFSVNDAPGATTKNPVPMPVKWLYVLRDGTYVAPTSPSNNTVTIPGATTTNPVVGRVAFWTDDETSKVNINTASEGTFWDTPTSNTRLQRGLSIPAALQAKVTAPYGNASSFPLQGEYDRYPGHPATTSLSAVLGNWLPIDAADQWNNPSQYRTALEQYWALTPRLYNGALGNGQASTPVGGTQGGTIGSAGLNVEHALSDADRLYSTVDELFFQPGLSGDARKPNNPALTPDVLQKTKFFLTAHSRAPEVTLFNTPRMSVWPIMEDTGEQTTQDKLLAFCATTNSTSAQNKGIYYFQRKSASTNGGYGSAYSPTADFAPNSRNVQLYQYIQTMTGSAIPGFGGTFSQKYGAQDRDQILTEMFDYIRSCVNLTPPIFTGTNAADKPPGYNNYTYTLGDYVYNTGANNAFYDQTGKAGSSIVIPLKPASGHGNGTKGFGRMFTITKAELVLFDADNLPASSAYSTFFDPSTGLSKDPAKKIQAYLLFEYFSPTTQYASQFSGMRIRVSGLQSFTLGGQNMGFSDNAQLTLYGNTFWDGRADAVSQMPPEINFFGPTAGGLGGATSPYPFLSSPMTFNDPSSTVKFTGGTITIQILNPTTTGTGASDVVQTITMDFPNATWPTPKLINPTSGTIANQLPQTDELGYKPLWSNPLQGPYCVNNFQNRLTHIEQCYFAQSSRPFQFTSNQNNLGSTLTPTTVIENFQLHKDDDARAFGIGDARLILETPGDVVRGVEATANGPFGGDYRLYCASPVVGVDNFAINKNYSSSDFQLRNGGTLRSDKFLAMGQYGYNGDTNNPTPPDQIFTKGETWRPSNASTAGALVKGITYTPWAVPNVPPDLKGALMSNGKPGDWETGVGILPDGPLIRMTDNHVSNGNSYTWDYGNIHVIPTASSHNDSGYYDLGLNFFNSYSGVNLTPNRQIASAVQFGALPTGALPNSPDPWQTLLFCPNPAGRTTPSSGNPSAAADHKGFGSPADELFLDLFWMPVVEPYAISEPLSTAGKVNMNYQIMPFSYIKRETAVDAVMKNVLMAVIPPSAVEPKTSTGSYSYKEWDQYPYTLYYNINLDDQSGTLAGFEQRFNKNEIFHSASEICSIFLIPQEINGMQYSPGSGNPNYNNITNFWNRNGTLTGDNLREAPYNQIYPRLTTKSNSYKIYVRVQALRQTPKDAKAGTWTEGMDQILGEYRGSYLIERYVDANDQNLPDIAKNLQNVGSIKSGDSPNTSLDDYYKFRVLERKQFNP